MYFLIWGAKFCVGLQSTKVRSQRPFFYTKVLVNENLVRLDRVQDYTGVGLERL